MILRAFKYASPLARSTWQNLRKTDFRATKSQTGAEEKVHECVRQRLAPIDTLTQGNTYSEPLKHINALDVMYGRRAGTPLVLQRKRYTMRVPRRYGRHPRAVNGLVLTTNAKL